MTTTPAPDENRLPEHDEKLRELTNQSWNLELVISGAALFAVLQLPDLLDEAFEYFRYNLMSQTTGLPAIFPSLVYSMLKATCYVLFLAFLMNFVMRAFWVSLVGLLAVYPTGIFYDRIPFTTKRAQDRMAAELGSLDAYILRLDRRCNIVFAVAFLFVFLLILVAFSYLLILVVYSILRPVIPTPYWQFIKMTSYGILISYLVISLVLSLPKVRAHPNGATWHYRFSRVGRWMFWGFYKPVMFIINTFYSHLPYQKILRTIALMMVAFFIVVLVEFVADLSRTDRRGLDLNRRHLYTARIDSHYINPGAYDDQRPDNAYIDKASIQADVIRDPFIRLYVAYPKALDTLLTRLAPEPVWSDTLSRVERRQRFANWSSQQINRLIHLKINDSLYRNPDLLFTQRGQQRQRGWQTVLLPSNLRLGKNTLQISIQTNSLKKTEEIITIPFWYIPEK